MTQSRTVARALEESTGVRVELVAIRTAGDRHPEIPLGPESGPGFFTSEIEQALLDGGIDLAVHSCKDLAAATPAGLRLTAVPPRADPRDALVSRGTGLRELPRGARVGTSSPRRRAFLSLVRPDLRLEHLRGNVPTRLEAVRSGALDAVILAVAGLERLGLGGRITETVEPEVMLPAAAQGALAVQTRDEESETFRMVRTLDHPESRAAVTAERACLRRLEAGCEAPVGALATVRSGQLRLEVAVISPGAVVRVERAGDAADPETVGEAAARDLLEVLGIDSLREAEWAGAPPHRPPSTKARDA